MLNKTIEQITTVVSCAGGNLMKLTGHTSDAVSTPQRARLAAWGLCRGIAPRNRQGFVRQHDLEPTTLPDRAGHQHTRHRKKVRVTPLRDVSKLWLGDPIGHEWETTHV